MSRSVDVLAAMDGCVAGTREALPNIPKKHWEECTLFLAEMEIARAAVAELIEAAKEVQADAKILGMDIPRLEAALACVGGPA